MKSPAPERPESPERASHRTGLVYATVALLTCSMWAVAGDPNLAVTEDPVLDEHQPEHRAALNDAWLEGRIESALLLNPGLDALAVDARIESGIARLHGYVATDIERDLAGDIVRSFEGVREVRNHLRVDAERALAHATTPNADERRGFRESVHDVTLAARIKSRLRDDPHTRKQAITVDSSDGVVTLSGAVASDRERELAVRIARTTSGSERVIDRIRVRPMLASS